MVRLILTMTTEGSTRSNCAVILAPRRDLCVDFVNTLAWRGSAPEESLHSIDDVLTWLASNGGISADSAAAIRESFRNRVGDAGDVVNRVIEMREAIYRMLHAIASGGLIPDSELNCLNEMLAAGPPRTTLGSGPAGLGWSVESEPTANGLLAPVIWSAADILVGPESKRLRECANSRCLWLFLDESKNGTRRWCSMQACGNRAKAHRHYLRQKGG